MFAAETIERNRDIIVATMRAHDGGLAAAAELTFAGMLRNLEHARAAIAQAEGAGAAEPGDAKRGR